MPLDESTRETYERYAREDHDWSESPDDKYIEWPAIRSLLPEVDGKRVLDAGCGTGVNAEWRPVFAEFHRVLRPGGNFVYSTGHPVSGWVNPEGASDYFAVERLSSDWGDAEIHNYRRPVGEHVNPLVEAGFRIARFLEPTPHPAYEAERPERYEKRSTVPRWECVRTRKLA